MIGHRIDKNAVHIEKHGLRHEVLEAVLFKVLFNMFCYLCHQHYSFFRRSWIALLSAS